MIELTEDLDHVTGEPTGCQDESAAGKPPGCGDSADAAPAGGLRAALFRVPPEVPIFTLYVLLAVFLTWPVIQSFTHNFYGFPSDNLGTMWGWWWSRNAGAFGASASFCPLIGYPFGQQLAPWTGEIVLDLSVRFMLLFAPQSIVYNVIITSSFALSGVTMYYLVRYITRDRRVAFFGGLAYLAGAFHAVHAQMFANLSITQWMPLYILALLVFTRKASVRNAALLLGAALLVVGTSVHYGLFMGVFTIAFLLGRFAYERVRQARREPDAREPVIVNRKALMLSLMVVFVVVAVVFPLFLLSFGQTNQMQNWPTRTTPGGRRALETARGGSASPLAYVLPEKENFFLGPITRKLAPDRVNMYENSLYLGASVMALALIGVVAALGPRRRRKSRRQAPAKSRLPGLPPVSETGEGDFEGPEPDRASGAGRASISRRGLVWGLLVAALAGFLLSMPPYFNIGARRVPLPSIILHYTVPWLRWYLRFGVVVIICFIVFACLGLLHLLERSGRVTSVLVLASLSVFLFLEMTLVPPARYFRLRDKPPGVFESIAGMDVPGMVVYPAFESGAFNSQRYLFYQQYHHKPMLNGGLNNSDGEALRRTVYNPFNPQTPGILKRFGISHVIYLDRMFEKYEGTGKSEEEVRHLPVGFELVERVGGEDDFGTGRIYRVTSPAAGIVPVYQGDITVPRIDRGRVTARLMEHEGRISLENYTGREVTVDLRLPVSNIASPHELTVFGGQSPLWQARLEGDQSEVIEIPGLRIPAGGLGLGLSVRGSRVAIDTAEIDIFGTYYATMRLGDLEISPAPGPAVSRR